MESLKKTIAKAKAGQLSNQTQSPTTKRFRSSSDARRSIKHEEEEEEEDLEAVRLESLREKSKAYEQIVSGTSRNVPAGALVDFEAITGTRLFHQGADGKLKTSADQDNVKSRSWAAIAPPSQLLQDVELVDVTVASERQQRVGESYTSERPWPTGHQESHNRQRDDEDDNNDDVQHRQRRRFQQTDEGNGSRQKASSPEHRRTEQREPLEYQGRRSSSPPPSPPRQKPVDEFGRDLIRR